MPIRTWLTALAFAFACDTSAPPPAKTTTEPTAKQVDAKVEPNAETKVEAEVEPTPETKVEAKVEPETKEDTKVEPKREDYGPQAVDMKGFDLKCKRDSDCTLVRPRPCGHCGCSNIPLRAQDLDRFNEKRNEIRCAPTPPEHQRISCGGCPGYTAYCKRGRCDVTTL